MKIDLYHIERIARVIGKKVYFFSRLPVAQLLEDRQKMRQVMGHHGGLIPAVLEVHYQRYKRGLGRGSAHDPKYNYIYRANKPFKLLDLTNDHDIEYYFEKVLTGEFREFWAKYNGVWEKSEEEQLQKLQKIKSSQVKKMEEWAIDPVFSQEEMRDRFWARMREVFDGIINDDIRLGHCQIFVDRLKKGDMKLVDGNMLRFGDTEKAQEGSYPEWVIEDLKRFTEAAGKRLHKETVEWLQENTPRDGRYRLYRGAGLFFNSTFNWWGGNVGDKPTEEEFNKVLKRRYGVTLDEIKKGAKIKVKRSKPSSWSMTPQVAREFTSGMASRDLNFLIVTEVTRDQVVVDLTKLPREVQNQLPYPNQNEVILTGPIEGVINDVWTSKKFDKWFAELGSRQEAVAAMRLDLHRIHRVSKIAKMPDLPMGDMKIVDREGLGVDFVSRVHGQEHGPGEEITFVNDIGADAL